MAKLEQLYPQIHHLIKQYIPSDNFYVVLFDESKQKLKPAYFTDEKDNNTNSDEFNFEQGVTGYVYRCAKSTYFTRKTVKKSAEQGHFKLLGALPEHWLGVPIFRDKTVIGVMVSQNYHQEQAYCQTQINLIETIALYLATAIERVKRRSLLKQDIKKQTLKLSEANNALNAEITERKRNHKRQQTLFKIAALATERISIDEVYYRVHQIMKTLTYAENLYIALYNKADHTLSFPYAVDQHNDNFATRPFGKGFSELVLVEQKCLLVDDDKATQLINAGKVSLSTSRLHSYKASGWLGAPLKTAQGVIGLIACQVYDNKYAFTEQDAELITYVSNQIANVLQNHLSQLALTKSYQELEGRVHEKTKALRQTNSDLQYEIAQRRKVEQQLYHDAHHDSLTELANRSLFMTQLEQTLKQYRRFPEQDFALLFLDLDKFKSINDRFGHQVGDFFLIEVAKRLRQCVREHDMLARLGGDEFVVLLTQLNHKQQAEDVAKRICAVMAQPFYSQGVCIESGASIGIAYSQSSYQLGDDMLRDADAAMYFAKQSPIERVAFYNPLLSNINDKDSNVHNTLNLLDIPYSFQPQSIYSEHTATPLAQLIEQYGEHPELGKTHFNQLYRFAHNNDDLASLTLKLLRQGFEQHSHNALNLMHCSIVLLEEKHFSTLTRLLEQHCNKNQLCLLFNEAELKTCTNQQLAHLHKLHQLGVRIGVDEFAKNRCDLNLLAQLPFYCVILNSTFCRRLLSETSYQYMLEGVSAVAKQYGCLLIYKQRIKNAQGYPFSQHPDLLFLADDDYQPPTETLIQPLIS